MRLSTVLIAIGLLLIMVPVPIPFVGLFAGTIVLFAGLVLRYRAREVSPIGAVEILGR